MENKIITIQSAIPAIDEFGGKSYEYTDVDIYGKLLYKKDAKVVNRAHDTLTQIDIDTYTLFANVMTNDKNALDCLKKGDILKIDDINTFKLDKIQVLSRVYIITFIKEV